jgi:anion-transporting  ArsA/GET3 family ATPase
MGRVTHTRLYSHQECEVLRPRAAAAAPTGELWLIAARGERWIAIVRATGRPASGSRAQPSEQPQRVCSATVSGLLDKRLVFVTGKGGVGKSTVATVLGLLAARRGRRTIVAELASQRRVQQAFLPEGEHFAEVELDAGLFAISIDPQQAMEEYLRVKAGTVGAVLGSSRLFQAFAMATPGMRELLSIGKVWELAQLERRTAGAAAYDFVIVDAPATGHGIGILRTPRTFAEIARVGPIARQGRTIADTIADRAFTGVVAVAAPEEMAVNETLALRDALTEEALACDAVILNALYPERFAAGEIGRLEQALATPQPPLAASAVRAALSEHARAATQQAQRERLRAGLGRAAIELPYLFCDRLERRQLDELADALEPQL